MQPISVAIITFNEEKNIARCIESVKAIADEVVVLDSFSSDNTIEIAKSMGATVHQEKFAGYIEQKNRVLDLASYNLVLSLDADEALDEILSQSISELKKRSDGSAFTMNRCTNYIDRFIRHGLWYPDKKLRLFDKRVARWGGVNPHDKVELNGKVAMKHLEGDILHYSYSSIEEHMLQNNKFSTISAEAMFKRGKRTSMFKIMFNPWWAFVNGYIFRAGFLDGFYGFVIAVNAAHLTFQKHVKLYRLQKNRI
jgi:glycosyltransferase involved in cell wall biosynthesis